MILGRFFSVSGLVVTSLLISSCGGSLGTLTGNSADRVEQEFGNLPSQLGGIVSGKTTYVLVPGFYEKLNPWIKDQSQFNMFMAKYNKGRKLTEKDRVDIVIQLGILQNAPQWLTPQALSLIDRYYPGYTKKKAENDLPYRLAFNELSNSANDAAGQGIILAQSAMSLPPAVLLGAPASLFSTGLYVDAIAFVAGINPVVLTAIAGTLITIAATKEILQHKQQICDTLGGCDNPEKEVDTLNAGSGNCTPDQKNRYQDAVENACGAADACSGNDTAETLGAKIGQASRCIDARKLINNVCFSGGDAGHQRAISERVNQIRNCNRLMAGNAR